MGKKNTDLSSIMFGKLPPQARDLEEIVLGSLMINKYAINDIQDFLKEEHFYDSIHVNIFQAILELNERIEPINIATVAEELKKLGTLEMVGGPYHLTELTSRVASADNIAHYAGIIVQKFLKRECIRVGAKFVQMAYDEQTDPFVLLDKFKKESNEIDGFLNKNKTINAIEVAEEIISDSFELEKSEDEFLGIPSGYRSLDIVTGGWKGTHNIVVAGRPAMGKTSFVINLLIYAAITENKKVLIFSLEMGKKEIVLKILSIISQIPTDKIQTGKWIKNPSNHKDIDKAIAKLKKAGIFICDTPSLTHAEMRGIARFMFNKHGIEIMGIDYLQLMNGPSGSKMSREQEISYISRNIKGIAKELDIPVISLSQLSRAVETRGGEKRPMLSDLRESGSIEQDADMVIFLYRPSYYGIMQDGEGNYIGNLAEIIIAKYRHGATGSVWLEWDPRTTTFKNSLLLDENNFQQNEKEF